MLQTNMYFGTGGTDIKTHLQGLIKKVWSNKEKAVTDYRMALLLLRGGEKMDPFMRAF